MRRGHQKLGTSHPSRTMAILPGVPEDLAAFAPPRASAVPLPGGAPVRGGGGMGGGGRGVAPQGGGEGSLHASTHAPMDARTRACAHARTHAHAYAHARACLQVRTSLRAF